MRPPLPKAAGFGRGELVFNQITHTANVRLQNFWVVSHLYKRHKWKWGRANQSRIGDRFPYSV
jgi:hypothetical protein